MDWSVIYLVSGIAGLVGTLLTTPCCRVLAGHLNLMDRPKSEGHKAHRKATPLMGGVAMFVSWLVCISTGYGLAVGLSSGEIHDGLLRVCVRAGFLVLGAALVVGLGLWDDWRSMGAGKKFLGQFLIALIAVWLGGVRISLFIDIPIVTWGITIFWYMLLMNALNFFDNMDGLAVGTATIAFGFFALTAAWQAQFFIATFSMLCCGVSAGFWWYNRAPASIFMGDSGSMFLGYMLATISASVTYYTVDAPSWLPVLLPVFILALPLFDTLAVVWIRLRQRKAFWIGDHNHISHRFVKMGMSRERAVDSVHLLALILALSVWPLLWADRATAFVLTVQALLLLGLITLLQSCVKIEK